jgi:hypothetical protein
MIKKKTLIKKNQRIKKKSKCFFIKYCWGRLHYSSSQTLPWIFSVKFYIFSIWSSNFFYGDLVIIILINKFSKHNQVNIPSFEIKYLDLHLSPDFSSFFLGIVNDFLFIYSRT